MAIVWKTLRVALKGSANRSLLILGSFSILIARIWMPAIESLDVLDLIYYMQALLFPIMLLALSLDEVEETYKQVSALLDQKTQSGEGLQFIPDNSLDITLIANSVGYYFLGINVPKAWLVTKKRKCSANTGR